MTIVLLENYIKNIVEEEIYNTNLLYEGKIYDWFKNKFKDSYSYFVYDKELVDMCAEWLDKNKNNKSKKSNKRRDSYKNIVNKQENKRFKFNLISMSILMTLVMNYNNLTKNDEGFNEAYETVSNTLNSNKSFDDDYDSDSDSYEDSPSRKADKNAGNKNVYAKNKLITKTSEHLNSLNFKEKQTIVNLFGLKKETEKSFYDLIGDKEKNSLTKISEIESESFGNYIEIANNLIASGKLTDEKEIDETLKFLLNAQSSDHGVIYRKEINNAYTDLSNYKEVSDTLLNISDFVDENLSLENSKKLKEKCDMMFNKKISSIEQQIEKSNNEKDYKRVENLQKIVEKLYNEYYNISFEI